MSLSRRAFASYLGWTSAAALLANSGKAMSRNSSSVAIATWKFGLDPCRKAFESLNQGKTVLDAVEHGIWIAEADIENRSVGLGGIPNASGVVELDACIMEGTRRRAGSVAALQDFLHPISVARRVMELTPHVMLVGDGAADFARREGFERTQLLVPREEEAFQKWRAKKNDRRGGIDPVLAPDESTPKSKGQASEKGQVTGQDDRRENHDTIALLVRNSQGQLGGGCSTSGWGYKLPGRVGDSPIIGGGLYVDDEAGAAGATGLGEIILRYCGSFLVVESMRRGADPESACVEAVQRILRGEQKPADQISANFIAIAPDGRVGAAGTDSEFAYAVVHGGEASIRESVRVG